MPTGKETYCKLITGLISVCSPVSEILDLNVKEAFLTEYKAPKDNAILSCRYKSNTGPALKRIPAGFLSKMVNDRPLPC